MLKRFQADWIKGALFVALVTIHHFRCFIPLIAIAAKWESFLRPYWFLSLSWNTTRVEQGRFSPPRPLSLDKTFCLSRAWEDWCTRSVSSTLIANEQAASGTRRTS